MGYQTLEHLHTGLANGLTVAHQVGLADCHAIAGAKELADGELLRHGESAWLAMRTLQHFFFQTRQLHELFSRTGQL